MKNIKNKAELVKAFKEDEHFRCDFENFIKIILREFSYPVKKLAYGNDISIYYDLKKECITLCDYEKDAYAKDSNYIYVTSMKRAYWQSIYNDYENIRKHIEEVGSDMVEDIINFNKWIEKKRIISDYVYYHVASIIMRMEKEIEEEKEEEHITDENN